MAGESRIKRTDFNQKRARLASYKIEEVNRPGRVKLFFMILSQISILVGVFELLAQLFKPPAQYYSFLGFSILTASVVFTRYVRSIQTKRIAAEKDRAQMITDLQETLAEVKILSGLLPICANCKKIRDSEGYWQQIEQYIRNHSDAEFSHAVCQECAQKLYPELYHEMYGASEGENK